MKRNLPQNKRRKKHMMYLIAGRTGSGKDYLAKKIVELSNVITDHDKPINEEPMTILKSYTTRPKRTESEDTHIFITKDEADTYTDKVATTKIGEYEYFATADQVEHTDLYIIDPNGIEELTKNMPDTEFQIIYVHADEDLNRRINAIKRAEDKIKEEEIFAKRNDAEDEQFTEFEDKIFNRMDTEVCFPNNVKSVVIVENKYTDQCMEEHACMIIIDRQRFQKMCNIVRECMDLGILTKSVNTDKNGECKIIAHRNIDGKSIPEEHTIEQCANSLLTDNDAFRHILGKYILVSPKF